jgi:NTE family protein
MSGKRTGARKRINLALQGGGSHGALTWGVLDRLLEDGRLRIGALSGTSAGAMNAVVLASGHAAGGAEGARAALAAFWRAVSDAARMSPIQRTPWARMRGDFSLDASPGYLFMDGLSRVFSPYDLNPRGVNPLREILEAHVDFGRVNAGRGVRVFVTATNVRTGRPRIFGAGDVTVDSVLASACLPQMFPAVEIDGEAYWDGGYAGNPALYPLLDDASSQDVVVVQINPIVRRKLPRTAREIVNRVNEISFNSSLIKEMRAIALTQRLADEAGFDLGRRRRFLHIVHAEEEVEDLDASSKLNAEWAYLQLLFDRGRGWAEAWLAAHYEDVGVRSTLDLDEIFEDAPRPPAVAEPEPDPAG